MTRLSLLFFFFFFHDEPRIVVFVVAVGLNSPLYPAFSNTTLSTPDRVVSLFHFPSNTFGVHIYVLLVRKPESSVGVDATSTFHVCEDFLLFLFVFGMFLFVFFVLSSTNPASVPVCVTVYIELVYVAFFFLYFSYSFLLSVLNGPCNTSFLRFPTSFRGHDCVRIHISSSSNMMATIGRLF